MVNYANAKIYKIVGDTGATYYGSTTQSLKDRMRKHRSKQGKYNTSAYQEIISQMDCEIILIENYPCDSKKELEDREAWYIRGNPCVNRAVPGRTHKEYCEDNREKILADMRKYHVVHREKKLDYAKIYDKWRHSFGDSRYTNCLQRCNPSLFA